MARSLLLLSVCAAVAIVGCGTSGPKTHPVTGKVTIDDQPAKNCTITFHPVDSANQVASGQVEDDGSYTLYTGTSGTPGAMAGKYKVVVVANEADMGTGEDAEPDYMSAGTDPTTDPTTQDSGLVPNEYTNATTTPKEVEVTAGSNTIDIPIKSGASGESESE
ncbi:MAG: hypothetical protein H8E44_12535 [Planctomycetes bacterium]|nr:hypothetical protein [Planctomycetota bacterium]